MAVTTNQAYEKALILMDIVPVNDTFDTTETAEYKSKAPYLMTILQNELMPYGDFFNTKTISRKPITPLIGGFDYCEHDDEDKIVESNEVAKAYYFEINGQATVYIEDYNGSWNTLDTLTIPSTVDSYTAYSGIITPTSGATKTRIRFSGSYYYNYTNYALFGQSFASTVPAYRPYVKYEMPSDFKDVDSIIKEEYPNKYIRAVDYYWEGKKDLYLGYNFDGNIRITYYPLTTPITEIDESTYLEIDDSTSLGVLPYGLAALLLSSENSSLSNFFEQKYEELKATLAAKPKKATIIQSQDVYNILEGM